MSQSSRKSIVVGISGASGVAYATRLIQALLERDLTVHVTISEIGRRILIEELELKSGPSATILRKLFPNAGEKLQLHEIQNVGACIASGSFQAQGMVVVPCSSGTLSRIAGGLSTNLIDRTADVMLKERRPVLLVLRETPLSLIQLENMVTVCRAGATVMPASPGFYLAPQGLEDLVDFIVARILDHLRIEHDLLPRWTGKAPKENRSFPSDSKETVEGGGEGR